MFIRRQINMKKGEIYKVKIKENIGSEQGGYRPVIILNSDAFKEKALVATLTTSVKRKLPVHIWLEPEDTGLELSSLVLLEQIKTIPKKSLKNKIGFVKTEEKWDKIENALKISLGL
jgi:mRNA interferase MazF